MISGRRRRQIFSAMAPVKRGRVARDSVPQLRVGQTLLLPVISVNIQEVKAMSILERVRGVESAPAQAFFSINHEPLKIFTSGKETS